MRLCTIPECGREYDSKGFCTKHWKRNKKYGNPHITKKPSNGTYDKKCLLLECNENSHCKGYCSKHSSRIRRHGNPYYEVKKLTPQERKERTREIKRKYKRTEKGKITEKRYKKSPGGRKKRNLLTQLRRRRMRKCTPKCLSEKHRNEIKELYKNCPKGMTVDHIIPIITRDPITKEHIACGLHVPWNLQYLTKSENSRKGNRIDVSRL